MRNILFFVCFTLILSSCKDQNPAPIEYNHDKSVSRKFQDDTKYPEKTVGAIPDANERISEQPLPINNEELEKPMGTLKAPEQEEDITPQKTNLKTIYYEVKAGDSVAQLAKRYEQTTEEITKLNNLNPPYHLEESQILMIKVSQELLNKINKEEVESSPSQEESSEEKSIQEHAEDKGLAKGSLVTDQTFVSPVENGEVIKKFGEQINGKKNYGINIAAKAGSDIKSVADGKVVYADFDKKFGNLIIVKLDHDDMYAAYSHMEDLILPKDFVVKQGELLGHVGSTGEISSPQLHFALRKGKTSVNPMAYLPF